MRTEAPDDLSDEDKLALFIWCKDKHPEFAERKRLRAVVDACLDWHRGEGKLKKSWLATCRVWIQREADRPRPRGAPPRGTTERRTESADETLRMLERRRREAAEACADERGTDFVPIGNVLSIVESIAGGRK